MKIDLNNSEVDDDVLLKDNITSWIQTKYGGTYRFLKNKLFINQFGNAAFQRVMDGTVFLNELNPPFSLRVRTYIQGITEMPICALDGCNNNTIFNSNNGWQKFCSAKCNANSENRLNRMTGDNNYFAKSDNIEKIKSINIQKFGVDNYTKTQEYRDRIKSGDIVQNLNPQKAALTHMESHYNFIEEKFKNIKKLFSFEEYKQYGASTYHYYKWHCKKCSKDFTTWLNMGYEPICTHCRPSGSKHERLFKEFLNQYKISFKFRDRKIMGNGREIDIYIPSKKLGIEINGLYFHNDKKVPKDYHYDKMIAMQKTGNDLIHIFDDEIFRKNEIVFNKLKYRLGLINRSIGARDCDVKLVNNKTKIRFLNKYHIQGNVNSSINLGLYYKNRLVALMTFGKPRNGIGSNKHPENSYELIRFCTIFNFNINGAASKLLSHFKKIYTWSEIYSYADRRWSTGSVYEKTGFKLTSTSKMNYWYTLNCIDRLHRSGFMKRERAKKLENHNPNISEMEDMKNHGYKVIWDCGTLTYSLRNPLFNLEMTK